MASLYSCSIPLLNPAATPTDVLSITGSATRIIRVLSIELFVSQTTAGASSWFIIRRSTANTGGTTIALTPVQYDTEDPAPTAVLVEYTANPTLGTAVGFVARAKIRATANLEANGYLFDFTRAGYKEGFVLRNTSEVLALNFNAAALPTNLQITGTVTYTEY